MFKLLLLTACQQDYGVTERTRSMKVAPLADAGGLTVGERTTVNVPLYSVGSGDLRADQITVVNEQAEEAFVLIANWANEDGDEDGVMDDLIFESGSTDLSVFEELQMSFEPTTEGYFRATITVDTNDNSVVGIDPVEGLHDGSGVHIFQVRGLARYPRSSTYPEKIDFGKRLVGGAFFDLIYVRNTGSVVLTIAEYAFEDGDSTAYYVETPGPVYVLPGDTEEIEVGYIPNKEQREYATLTLLTSDPEGDPMVELIGNNCEDSLHPSWDSDGDGALSCGSDCDDSEPSIRPDGQEVPNGKDDDCDGQVDETADGLDDDDDNDGLSENEGDCNDDDPNIGTDAEEDKNNKIDDDCDGFVDEGSRRFDDDLDGFTNQAGDCNDYDNAIFPGAVEVADEIDNDCDENIDEGTFNFDDDQDGVAEADGDCDDYDAWTYPGAPEDCDQIDNDCDNFVDEGDGGEDACDFLADLLEAPPPASGCSATDSASGLWALGLLALLGLLGLHRRQDSQKD
jgi:MYXO-CTERM domain-containing protein